MDTPCPIHHHTPSIFSISSWTPMYCMPWPYSLHRPSFICDVAYICQSHTTWMIRVMVHDIVNSCASSRLTSAISYQPSMLWLVHHRLSSHSMLWFSTCYPSLYTMCAYCMINLSSVTHQNLPAIIDLLYSFSKALNFVHTQNKEIPCFINKNI